MNDNAHEISADHLVKLAQIATGNIRGFYGQRSNFATRRPSAGSPAPSSNTASKPSTSKPFTGFSVPVRQQNPGLGKPGSEMTMDQFKSHMSEMIRKYQSQHGRSNRNLAGQLRQLYSSAQTADPSQLGAQLEKARQIMANASNNNGVNAVTSTSDPAYGNSFDASGRRLKGSTIQYGMAPSVNSRGWKQVGPGISIIPRKGNAADAKQVARYGQVQKDRAFVRGMSPDKSKWWSETLAMLRR